MRTSLIITVTLIILCSGCTVISPVNSSIVSPQPGTTEEPTVGVTIEPTPTPIYHPGGPNIIRLYVRRNLVEEEFQTEWTKGKDIGIFYAYPVDQDSVEQMPFMDLFKKYWYVFPAADEYKIGYSVSIHLQNGEIINMMIRLPMDCPKDPNAYFYQFIEIYVYDNLNRIPGPTFYHLEEESTYENTIMTSIKLTAGSRSDEVKHIKLTAFVFYDNSDFDPTSGQYIGKTFCEVVVMPYR